MTTPEIEPVGERPSIVHARTAEDALKALTTLGSDQLAAMPAEAYTLLDHLTMVIGHTVTITAQLADQLGEWAELCHDTPTAHDTGQWLARTRRTVGLGVVPHACGLYHRFEAALTALDHRRYRIEHGIPLDYPNEKP